MATPTPQRAAEPVLTVSNLTVDFRTADGIVHAVDDVSFELYPSEILGIVGESGSGKSVTVLSILRLVPQPPGVVRAGEIRFRGVNLLDVSDTELERIRGGEISMIFQDPMTSLNPVLRVGSQIAETIRLHNRADDKKQARRHTIELLELVGVSRAAARYDQYPHEFSGGMRQRAMIAMAIANQPEVLIADEPTTALDVTIQAQVLDVLRTAQRETSAAAIVITHDLGVIAELADRVVVLYGGRVMESGSVETIFHQPRHPYTVGLMASLPSMSEDATRLQPIPGQPPNLIDRPTGCVFHPRCALRAGRAVCRDEVPPLRTIGAGHLTACHFAAELSGLPAEPGLDPDRVRDEP